MKKSLLSLGVAMLFGSNGVATMASELAVPNTFVSGTPAVAAQVNDNFNAVKASVDDNNARITALEGGAPSSTCVGNDATDIMMRVGSLCVDKYESSVWNTAQGGGTQYGVDADDYPCLNDGSDCGAAGATPIFARSEANQTPSSQITWYQAAQACANAGKRLPSTAEWVMAAAGTPDPGVNTDLTIGCNTDTRAKSLTGEAANCLSASGVSDMGGNVRELVADLNLNGPFGATTTDNTKTRILGSPFDSGLSGADTSVKALFTNFEPNTEANVVGFRCVR